MPIYTSTGAFNVAVNDTTGTGRYSASGALRINLVTGSSYVGLYAADGALNVVDVSGVAVSAYGGLYHPSGAIRGRTAPTTLSGLQAPDGSYYFLGLFSPLNLFANGEQGAWYDPSDLTTMFQDAAGTTPVTAVEQPVGLLLDKSKGLALGAELASTILDSTTNWTFVGAATVSGNALVFTTPPSGSASATYNPIVTSGKRYKFSCTITGTGLVNVRLGSGGDAYNNIVAPGVFTFYGIASGGTPTTLNINSAVSAVNNFVGSVTNISVRELPGNHASQSTAASRPVLSARVNALTYTEDFSNAAWVKSGLLAFGSGSTANAAVAPNGTTTADLITESTATSRHEVQQAASPVLSGSTAYVFSFYAKEPPANSRRYVQTFSNGTDGTWHANFDLNAGVVSGIGSNGTASITSVGDGWFRCVWNFTSAASPAGSVVYISLLNSGTAARAASYTGDGTSGIYLWGADLRPANVGVNLPAYQRVGAAVTATTNPAVTGVPDYDTSGFPLYLKFDGVDDSLATGTINPGAVDKAQVFAGVRKLSDAAFSCLYELSSSFVGNNGVFVALPSWDGGAGSGAYWTISSKGTIGTSLISAASYAAPQTIVHTHQGDISGDRLTLRANGTQIASSTADQGTGNYLAYPLYIGRRGGSSLPFNGHLYSLIVRFSAANLTDAQIASTETYVNNLTKAY